MCGGTAASDIECNSASAQRKPITNSVEQTVGARPFMRPSEDNTPGGQWLSRLSCAGRSLRTRSRIEASSFIT